MRKSSDELPREFDGSGFGTAGDKHICRDLSHTGQGRLAESRVTRLNYAH